MTYQLILQLPTSSIEDYDELVALEEIIIKGLGNLGKGDGHDAGSGEMNIFILTDHPQVAFAKINSLLAKGGFIMSNLKVAYRIIGSNKFTILHPAGLTHFAIA